MSRLSVRTKLMPLRYKKILVAINNSLDLIHEAIRLIDTDKDKFIEDVNTLAIKKKSFHKTLSGKWRD